jgi:putative toxin-antitoxin system antitoxin component (TIGR02293 family)
MKDFELSEPSIAYGSTDDNNIIGLIALVRQGVAFAAFENFTMNYTYTLGEWSQFLHLSERSMQRYKKENRVFDPLQSEKILEIVMLFKLGKDVFGSDDKFLFWLNTDNLALGGIKPVSLIDNTFGISLLKDELTRIEYGVLA